VIYEIALLVKLHRSRRCTSDAYTVPISGLLPLKLARLFVCAAGPISDWIL
jgi:hypothetical protein